jgi:hypothetical protein
MNLCTFRRQAGPPGCVNVYYTVQLVYWQGKNGVSMVALGRVGRDAQELHRTCSMYGTMAAISMDVRGA